MKNTPSWYLLGALLCFGLTGALEGATAQMDLSLTVPKLERVSAQEFGIIPPIDLQFTYDAKGKLSLASGSKVGTNTLTASASLTKGKTGFAYSVSAKGISNPLVSLVLKGSLSSNVASCTYAVGKSKVVTNVPVVVAFLAPVKATLTLNSQMDAKGKITGTGSIVSGFGNDALTGGILKGSSNKTSLTWQLKQGGQSVTFSGKLQTNKWVGSLSVGLPPEKSSFKNFQFPGLSKSSSGGGTSGIASFQGVVSETSAQGGAPNGVSDVRITLRCDLNGDGAVDASETTAAQTGADGSYTFGGKVVSGGRAVLEFAKEGYAKEMKVLSPIRTNGVIANKITLRPLSQLAMTGANASSSDGKLELKGLPSSVKSVEARVFNPVTEADHFPGEFADNQGKMLISSVFTAIEAKDSSGASVTNLGAGTTLKMQVPKDTWNTMKDLQTGNGQIDVPLYYFDDQDGQWKRANNNGWLENGSGAKLSETQLASVRDGTFSGSVYVVGTITHLSYWNCDWPVDTHACISGVVVDSQGAPVAGAVVTVKGVSYNGSTSPQVTGTDGGFCADMMRSEGAGEDINDNGVTGETQSVSVTVVSDGSFYQFGPFNSPLAQGTCDSGGCLGVGSLALTEANRLQVTLCSIAGKFVRAGANPAPVAGAVVYGWDEGLDPSAWYSYLTNGAVFYSETDQDGNFALQVPVLTGATLHASGSETISQNVERYVFGTTSVVGCPTRPVTIEGDFWSWYGLTGTDVTAGYVYAYAATITVWFQKGTDIFTATSTTSAVGQFPSQNGQTLTLDLYHYSSSPLNNGKVGTITFTGTGPTAGTWQTSGTFNLSGAWGGL
jgi:hypothetical protein